MNDFSKYYLCNIHKQITLLVLVRIEGLIKLSKIRILDLYFYNQHMRSNYQSILSNQTQAIIIINHKDNILVNTDQQDDLSDESSNIEGQFEVVNLEQKIDKRINNFVKIVLLLFLIIGSYQYINTQTDYIIQDNLEYIKVSTRYQDNFSNVEIYIPRNESYQQQTLSQCVSDELGSCWRQLLINRGYMIQQIEEWILHNVNQKDSILIVWQESLALSILLLSQRLVFLESIFRIRLIVSPQSSRAQINCLKLTLQHYNLTNWIIFDQTEEILYLQKIQQHNLIIGSSQIFHSIIYPSFSEIEDQINEITKPIIIEEIYEFTKRVKLLLLYSNKINQEQKELLLSLQNQVYLIKITNENEIIQTPLLSDQEYRKQSFNVVMIDRRRKQKLVTYLPQKQVSNHRHDQRVKIKTILQPITRIERSSPQTILNLFKCRPEDNSSNFHEYQFIKTKYSKIQVRKQSWIDPSRDYSHIAHFLYNYFHSTTVANVLYLLHDQQLANLISLTKNGQLYILTDDNFHSLDIKSSLQRNKLNYYIHQTYPDHIQYLISQDQIGLTFTNLDYFQYHNEGFLIGLQSNMHIIMEKIDSSKQKDFINNLQQKGLYIYIIFSSLPTNYNIQCIKDFKFQLFRPQTQYPKYSFFMISKVFMTIEGINPVNYPHLSFERPMVIEPYECNTQQSFVLINISKQQGVLMNNKYHLPIFVTEQQFQLYKAGQIQQEGLIEFLRLAVFANDIILVYGKSTDNVLVMITLLSQIQGIGNMILNGVSEDVQQRLQISSQFNKLGDSYKIIEQKLDSFYIYEGEDPTIILIDSASFKQDFYLLDTLSKNALVMFKYFVKDVEIQNLLIKSLQKFTVYVIGHTTNTLQNNQCLNFELIQIKYGNIQSSIFGWFVILI